MNKSSRRDSTIDIVRTIAIVIMMAANLGSLLDEPHPMWFRYYCSFAAPLFVALAGMMVGFAVINNKNTAQFSYFVKRGLFLILCAAFVDAFIWEDTPFISVDVLYLTGLGLPLAYLATRLSAKVNLAIVACVVGLTTLLQSLLGYSPEVFNIDMWTMPEFSLATLASIGKMWLIEGWFPLFPWLGYISFGVALAKMRWSDREYFDFASIRSALLGSALSLVGYLLMIQFPTTYFARDNYAELFYPSTIGFALLSFGVIMLVFFLAEKTKTLSLWQPLLSLGEASLFVYISHVAIIEIIERNTEALTTNQYLLVLAAMTMGLIVVTRMLRSLKKAYRDMPLLLRWVIGS